jgi:large subunit ribosomal protein L22
MTFNLIHRMASLSLRSGSTVVNRSFASLRTASGTLKPFPNPVHANSAPLFVNNHSTTVIRSLSSQPIKKRSSEVKSETVLAIGPDGTKYAIPLSTPLGGPAHLPRHTPKLKPSIVKERVSKLKTVSLNQKNIRHSPWRMNLVCQFAARETSTVEHALQQLSFVQKVKAPLVQSLVHDAANTAKQKYGLLPSQLEVVECFATHGSHLKRIKVMGRGRAGKMYRRFSHVRIVLREIDFPLKILQCKSINQRLKWVELMEKAEDDKKVYMEERKEIEELESQVEEMRKKKKEEEELEAKKK